MNHKKNLFRPPVLRTIENQGHERKVTWLELFFDLAFVAAIASLAEVLSHHYSVSGFLQFAFIFVIV